MVGGLFLQYRKVRVRAVLPENRHCLAVFHCRILSLLLPLKGLYDEPALAGEEFSCRSK